MNSLVLACGVAVVGAVWLSYDSGATSNQIATDGMTLLTTARVDVQTGETRVRAEVHKLGHDNTEALALGSNDRLELLRDDRHVVLDRQSAVEAMPVYGTDVAGTRAGLMQVQLLRDGGDEQHTFPIRIPHQPTLGVVVAGQPLRLDEPLAIRYSGEWQPVPLSSMAIESTVVNCVGAGNKSLDYAPYRPGDTRQHSLPTDGRLSRIATADIAPKPLTADPAVQACVLDLRVLAVHTERESDVRIPREAGEPSMGGARIDGINASMPVRLTLHFY